MEEKLKKIALLVKELQDEAKAENATPPPHTMDFITLGEAAALLKVSKTQILRLEIEGKLKVHRLSARKLYVSKSLLEATIKAQ